MRRSTSLLVAALVACGAFSAVASDIADLRSAAEFSLSGGEAPSPASGVSPAAAAAAVAAQFLDLIPGFLLSFEAAVADTLDESVQQFLTDMLGRAWPDSLPASWSAPSFDWARLGDFEYSSSLSDFLDTASLHNLTAVRSVRELAQVVHSMEDAFCSAEKFSPSSGVPSSCTGPTISLAISPKTCVLEAQTKQAVCTPAKLVLIKTPGSCTHKYDAPLSWVGKACKLTGSVGHNDSYLVGGGKKAVPLPRLDPSFDPSALRL
ncbi:hypothetical protein ABPG75_008770 [Micractinium tetrahymenae]